MRYEYLEAMSEAIKETFSVEFRTIDAWRDSSLFLFDRKVHFNDPSQESQPLDRSKYEGTLKPTPGKRIPIAGRVLTDSKVIAVLYARREGQSRRAVMLKPERNGTIPPHHHLRHLPVYIMSPCSLPSPLKGELSLSQSSLP